jgi:hypothetical protein
VNFVCFAQVSIAITSTIAMIAGNTSIVGTIMSSEHALQLITGSHGF